MAQPPYGSWNPEGIKSEGTPGQEQFSAAAHAAGHRRAGEQQQLSLPLYELGYTHQTSQYRRFADRGIVRPPSSSPTSSLSGAMGETHISHPNAPSTSPSGMAWTPSHVIPQEDYLSGDTEMASYLSTPPTPITSASPSGAFSMYSPYNMPPYSTTEPISPQAGMSSAYPEPFPFHQQRQPLMQSPPGMPSHPPLSNASASASVPISRSSRSVDDEVQRLQFKVRELETHYDSARRRVKELEHELAHSTASTSSLPSPLPTPTLPSLSPVFQADWKARTDARVKIWCSPNRAGNALCAWHDSRRERRAYPPRMAPAGYLNCGCTYEQALFEESLARHNVGSYHPGENVRMDPALRNPLLELLKRRYGYRDGDFERDIATGGWVEGEGATLWEAKLASGATNARKNRSDGR
ncbi:hypothetical protein B0H21DRAFT_151799 [Amylocystis lapponica]|nr:hypothetical protein B0H21DRAFT_200107 [Amylocystis lapponica]KAH9924374.1 hypothetical protein B0H21DRAFT_151799 [Amylocystis lapponica]